MPIRKIVGWTAEEFGEKIGVTNIQSILDYEIANNKKI